MRLLFHTHVVLALGIATASAGEVLYNGIELPDDWPPKRTFDAVKARETMAVPYLAKPPAVIPIDVDRQLFVDDFLIESTTLKRVFHPATMHEGNPALKPHQPWEMEGRAPMAMPFSDGVWFDPKDSLFKLWYMAGYGRATAYATSKDGIHWEKPQLDVRQGSNIAQGGTRDSSTVWLDHAERDPQRRFKMFRAHSEDGRFGLSLHYSADGVHWGERVLRTGSCGDRSTVFWNPFRQVWVYSLRHGWGTPRARRYWEVKDLLAGPQWTKIDEPPVWVGSDLLDPPREDLQEIPQLYNLDAVAYESLMLGLFTIWRGDKNIPAGRPKPNSVWLGFSRDGFHWDRPHREAFIPVSEKQGDWNWGNVQSVAGCCLVVGDRLFFYFSGRAGAGDKEKRDGGGATGLAYLRRDGFASMNAASSGGELTTRVMKFAGRHLFVNVAAPRGELRVEALGEDGRVIAPFSRENCKPLTADSTRVAVKWNGAEDLSTLAGKPVQFRFHLSNGDLYSFWVSPESPGASMGYVGAGGPGFRSDRDAAAPR